MPRLMNLEKDSAPIRVLVVEDENIVALELEHLLARLGHRQVASLSTGEAAIEAVAAHRPDVVLMDIRLRGAMDGIAAAEEIRKQYGTPIIYITAYSDARTLNRVKSSEPYGYILKPINIRELDAVLQIAVYRKRMEMQLRAREEQYFHLFERSNDAIVILRTDTLTIVNSNSMTSVLLGQPPEALRDRPMDAFVLPEYRQRFSDTVKALSVQAGARIEMTLRSQKSKEFEVEISLSLMDEEAGWVQAVIRDVSERNRMQRALKESEKLAAQGRMAARIAHEINNPLGGIKNSFLLIKDAVPETHPYFGYVARIENEIDRIARIVKQMGSHYRPGSGRFQDLDLRGLIHDVLSMLTLSNIPLGISFIWDPPDSPVLQRCVRDDLMQVLYNLVQNAVDASKPGGTVEIRLLQRRGQLRIEVIDQGAGLSEEARSRLFEPFFTTKTGEGQQGLGLGLSVSRSLVEAMSGVLGYESGRKGTTFYVEWMRMEKSHAE